MFHVSIWRAWSFVWGAKAIKAPRSDGTEYRLRSGTENNLTHIFLVLVAAGLGHGVYRKLYTSIGGQRAEKFENHCFKLSPKLTVPAYLWLNTNHLRNFRSDNLSQDKSCKEIINGQDKEKFNKDFLKMIRI